MSGTAGGARERVAGELARHSLAIGVNQQLVLCMCGWKNRSTENLSFPFLNWSRHVASDVLTLPELAALLADAERVRRVRKLVAFYDRHEYSSLNVDDLHDALTAADPT